MWYAQIAGAHKILSARPRRKKGDAHALEEAHQNGDTTATQMNNLLDFINAETRSPSYILEDLLPAGAIVYFSGPRKRGFKTFAQKFLTMVAAFGQPYFCGTAGKPQGREHAPTLLKGERVTLKPTRTDGFRILSFQQEGTVVGNKERLGKIGIGIDAWPVSALQFYTNALGFPDYRIVPPTTNNLISNFHFVHRPGLKFHNSESMKRLHGLIDQIKPDVVVLDSTTFMHNGKENDPENMLAMVDGFFSIRAKGPTVLAVMHTGKDSQRNTDLKDIDLDLRGHSSLLDAYDAHFGFRRWSAKGSGWIDLVCRYREQEEQQFRVRWEIPKRGEIAPIKLHMTRVVEEE
jgi:hypothetical protein